MTHCIKIEADFADAVVSGDKNFEIRKNDRGYQKGDLIKFIPLHRNFVKDENHPLNDKLYVVTYVLSGHGLAPEFVAFGIREVTSEQDIQE